MDHEPTTYREHNLEDRITRYRYVANKELELTHQIEIQPLAEQEEIMDQLKQHTGDGNAKFVVGAELATSVEYGNKAGAFCTISVTCNNSLETIKAVHDLVQPLVQEIVTHDLEIMEDLRHQILHGTPVDKKPIPRSKVVNQLPPKVVSAMGAGKPDLRR